MKPILCPRQPPRRRLGLRVIVGYKIAKAAVEFAGASAIALALEADASLRIAAYAVAVHEHFAAQWSRSLSNLLVSAAQPHYMRMAALALVLDGVMTLFEGTVLYRGWWWGPWVVVIATSTLLPVELAGIFSHGVHFGRIAVLAANVAVVVYLTRHALRERARLRAAGSTPGAGFVGRTGGLGTAAKNGSSAEESCR